VTLYVGLVAFSVITVTLCFVASFATSSPNDLTRRYCRACCQRFLRLRDEPELPPEVTSSSSQVDEPPSYEQALVMVAVVDEATLRCVAAEDLPAVPSTHHLIASDAAAVSDGGGASVTSRAGVSCSSSTPMNDHVVTASPPNYFEVLLI